jgi:alkanesulfonate monooxygenase SsuD/methylene tetrahydromethanopterin reductase-like flavin-dependent oxidoreductase (luciferase family)
MENRIASHAASFSLVNTPVDDESGGDVRVGVRIPRDVLVGDVGRVRSLLERVAANKIDHVCVGDHVSFNGGQGFDGIVQAAVLAAAHPELPVQIAVYLLPLRHPVLVARQLSTLAALAPGRITFGVGVGGEDRHEVEITGVDPKTRGTRMDECLRTLRQLLAGESVTLHGRFFDFEDARVLPRPEPPITILVGGRSEAAFLRAATLGDGWLGIWMSPDRFTAAVSQIDHLARDAHRSWQPQHTLHTWCGLAADRPAARRVLAASMESLYQMPFERFERYSPFGEPAEVARELSAYLPTTRRINVIVEAPDVGYGIDAVGEVRRLLVDYATTIL